MGTIILPKPMVGQPELSRVHTLAADFFAECASQKRLVEKDYYEYASRFLLETIHAIYGDKGLEFILRHQETHHDDYNKPDNGAT
jgi:hypothetical protein